MPEEMITQAMWKQLSPLLTKANFGLEKEHLRVTPDARLALTPHPAIFGDKSSNPFITTDFSESQMELISPPLPSISELCNFMHNLHDVVSNELGDELPWPQSMPAILPPEEDIPIAQYKGEFKAKEQYRKTLATNYGKSRQLICGIHFNISLADELLEALSSLLGNRMPMGALKEYLYLKMTRTLMRERWLLIWLFGETPMAAPNFRVRDLDAQHERMMQGDFAIALRTGPLGYRNKDNYVLDFDSVEGYNKVLDGLVNEGKLSHANELYLPIRLKFLAADLGKPSYLELRFLDLDPLSPYGVNQDALYACYMLFLYALLVEEKEPFDGEAQAKASLRHDEVACFGRCAEAIFSEQLCGEKTLISEAASELLRNMRTLLSEYGILQDDAFEDAMAIMESYAAHPDTRPGVLVYEGCKEEGFINYHLKLAKRYKDLSASRAYHFLGQESMEMSTQLLMRAALCKGVSVEILDASENFIRLSRDNHSQLVVQATKTSLDDYAAILAMENKVVTKKLLAEQGIAVPAGEQYANLQDAVADFALYSNRAFVIKPKSTNFGLGISIFKQGASLAQFQKALEFAFSYDQTILIEYFITGREFRFFLIDGKLEAILLRVPANVLGDGKRSIRELVTEKNKDTRRGHSYRRPLEKIVLGEEEALFLELQGASFDSIPDDGEIIYLRENSNISTGGDSIDFTDIIHDSYKRIAEHASKVLNVRITGLDMMIDDVASPAEMDNHAIIEMNFNPAIHIHCFPYIGENRRLNFKIIKALGFD